MPDCKEETSDSKRVIWFDAVRGLSALAVCSGHLRAVVFVDFGQVEKKVPLLTELFYFCMGLGHHAVVVFFVLSGFFVGGSVLAQADSFSWKKYLTARLTRLWVVLLPALVLTLLVDNITLAIDHRFLTGEFYHDWSSGPSGQIDHSTRTFIGNVIFVQTVTVPVFGSNGPLWSLCNEFWYYILFPLVAIRSKNRYQYCVQLILAALLALWLPTGILVAGSAWLIGVLIYSFRNTWKYSEKVASRLTGVSAIFFGAALLLSKIGVVSNIHSSLMDFGLAIFFAPFLIFASQSQFPQWRWLRWLAIRSADISYTLYVTHFPIVVLLGAVAFSNGPIQPSASSLATFALLLSALISFAYFFWAIFERNTNFIRSSLMAQIHLLSRNNRRQDDGK